MQRGENGFSRSRHWGVVALRQVMALMMGKFGEGRIIPLQRPGGGCAARLRPLAVFSHAAENTLPRVCRSVFCPEHLCSLLREAKKMICLESKHTFSLPPKRATLLP